MFQQPNLQGLNLSFAMLQKIDTTQADIIKGALEQQEIWAHDEEILRETLTLLGDEMPEKIVDLGTLTSGVVDNTIQWQQGLMGVQGVLGIINTTLLLTGERMGGMAKVLRFLMVGLNIASSIGSVAALFNPVSAVTKTVGAATGGFGSVAFKQRGSDLVGTINTTNGISSALGAN